MKLYLETTMFNYYFDVEREGHSDIIQLFESIRTGQHEAYTSEYVTIELRKAPEPKRSMMLDLITEFNINFINTDDEIDYLADLYITRKAIPERCRFDSSHIAAASVYGLDCLLSYNFQHINRVKTKLLTGRINNENGYETVVICTAKEVLDDEQTYEK